MHAHEHCYVGHYYQSEGLDTLCLAVSTGRHWGRSVWLAPYRTHSRVGWLRLGALSVGLPSKGLTRAHLQPAEVVEGAVSERGYMMRALRHPTSGEVIVSAGCRVELGFEAFLKMLRDTVQSSSRTATYQWQLESNLDQLRRHCRAQGWKVGRDLSDLV